MQKSSMVKIMLALRYVRNDTNDTIYLANDNACVLYVSRIIFCSAVYRVAQKK